MKLPWIREEQKSVSSVMVALSQLGAARWGGRSGEALMRDGYLRNAVAYRCVRMVAGLCLVKAVAIFLQGFMRICTFLEMPI